MSETVEKKDPARDEWYAVGISADLKPGEARETILVGEPIDIRREPDGAVIVSKSDGRACPVRERYGHVWTSIGAPDHDLFDIPEADQEGRVLVDVGAVRVRCSPLRAVENFLDIAHFPYVHTDILGAEPQTEVVPYKVHVEEAGDEVWATKVKFFQPQAAKSAEGGIITDYKYRVPAPTTAILYKTCPPRPGEWDVITIFVQPIAEDLCDVWPWMALFDEDNSLAELIHFQQMIFLQDRSILENQVPKLLPLDPKMEIPTRADMTSVAYRRWLKRRGMTYGAQTAAA